MDIFQLERFQISRFPKDFGCFLRNFLPVYPPAQATTHFVTVHAPLDVNSVGLSWQHQRKKSTGKGTLIEEPVPMKKLWSQRGQAG